MPSTRDIRRRIKSVKNTRQITKAMELVAASKMKKAQQAAIAGRPYAELLAEMLGSIASRLENSPHPFFQKREVRTRGILLVSTDRGLCGPLNSNLFRLVQEQEGDIHYVSIGRKGTSFLSRTRRRLLAEFPIDDKVPFAQVRVAAEFLVKEYLEGRIDTIEVLYPRFINTLAQAPTLAQVLPITDLSTLVEKLRAQNSGIHLHAPVDDARPMLFEPSLNEVLERLLPLYLNREIYQFVLSARASEYSARMVAMKTAKDNASKLIDELTLEYNKARQAAITQEILEIAAASSAA